MFLYCIYYIFIYNLIGRYSVLTIYYWYIALTICTYKCITIWFYYVHPTASTFFYTEITKNPCIIYILMIKYAIDFFLLFYRIKWFQVIQLLFVNCIFYTNSLFHKIKKSAIFFTYVVFLHHFGIFFVSFIYDFILFLLLITSNFNLFFMSFYIFF